MAQTNEVPPGSTWHEVRGSHAQQRHQRVRVIRDTGNRVIVKAIEEYGRRRDKTHAMKRPTFLALYAMEERRTRREAPLVATATAPTPIRQPTPAPEAPTPEPEEARPTAGELVVRTKATDFTTAEAEEITRLWRADETVADLAKAYNATPAAIWGVLETVPQLERDEHHVCELVQRAGQVTRERLLRLSHIPAARFHAALTELVARSKVSLYEVEVDGGKKRYWVTKPDHTLDLARDPDAPLSRSRAPQPETQTIVVADQRERITGLEARINSLMDQLRDREAMIERLDAHVTDLKHVRASLERETEQQQARVDRLRDEMATFHQEREAYRAELDQVRAERDNLAAQLQAAIVSGDEDVLSVADRAAKDATIEELTAQLRAYRHAAVAHIRTLSVDAAASYLDDLVALARTTM